MVEPAASDVRYRYPIHAVLLEAIAWLFFFALIAGYTTLAIALFPFSPLFAVGGACMISFAHDYLVSMRKQVRSTPRGAAATSPGAAVEGE
jgi:hypothetical protein